VHVRLVVCVFALQFRRAAFKSAHAPHSCRPGNLGTALLNRMNSAFIGHPLSRKKRNFGLLRKLPALGLAIHPGAQARLRVDSRTTNSGATLRWVGQHSRFSSTALMPSSTMPTADVPMASIGCRTVVSDGL